MLRLLFTDLLGFDDPKDAVVTQCPTLKKRELLAECLKDVAVANRGLQRLVTEFEDLLAG